MPVGHELRVFLYAYKLKDKTAASANPSRTLVGMKSLTMSLDSIMERAADLTEQSAPAMLHLVTLAQDDDDARTPGFLNFTGNIFWKRYEAGHGANDLERAISSFDRSVSLTPDLDPERGVRLVDLGLALWTRFQTMGNASDIDTVCSCFESSLLNEPRGARACTWLGNLGGALIDRLAHSGDISDLARAIDVLRQALEVATGEDPNRTAYLNNLSLTFKLRYDRFGNISDLDEAIIFNQQAVQLTRDGHPDKPSCLSNLGNALEKRFGRLGDISDLGAAISVKRQAVELAPDGHPDKPSYLVGLGTAFRMRFCHLGAISDLNAAISTNQQALNLTPDGHLDKPSCLNNLGNALERRFGRLGDIADLEAAIAANRKAVELTQDGHPEKPSRLNNLGIALQTRFCRLGEVSDLEAAIPLTQQAVKLTPDGHPDKPGRLNNLGNAFQMRFHSLGAALDLEAAISVKQQAVKLTSDGRPDKPRYLSSLGDALESRFDYLGNVSDLEAAITANQQAVELIPAAHPDKAGCLSNLSNAFEGRFIRLGDVLDLQSAIAALEISVGLTPDEHGDKPFHLWNLTKALMLRYQRHGNVSDLEVAIDKISSAAQSVIGLPRIKFQAAQWWSQLCEMVNDEQQALRAYRCAIALVPQVAWMGLAIEGRHRELEQILVGELVRKAAAAAVRSGKYDQALQWLEQGRSVVWGQSLQLRSPLDLLKERDPIRADRLQEISRVLESNAKDRVLSAETRGEQLRALVLEWEALVLEVRKLEGFEDFHGAKGIAQLLKAAASYPVIVLNPHETGCDALVLLPGADGVMHVSLDFDNQRAQILCDALEKVQTGRSLKSHTDAVERHLDKKEPVKIDPDTRIRSLLAELWSKVVKPVLNKLAFSLPENNNDDLPRICWCPTGPLAFLPLHAAGLYDNEDPGTKVFDYVVSSYTPTVAALLRFHHDPSSQPRILAIAQSTTPGQVSLPNAAREVDLLRDRATANSIEIVTAYNESATVTHVLNEMVKYQWIHLACHGTQDLESPTKSAFLLSDGKLELSEIIKYPHPHAEFAFLSACKTAAGDEKLSEEAVHLAAGMMLAGFRSVIATTWSIRDQDGPLVANVVYKELLKDGKADASRVAHALHKAVQQRRLSGAPFLAWMPFIHMGM